MGDAGLADRSPRLPTRRSWSAAADARRPSGPAGLSTDLPASVLLVGLAATLALAALAPVGPMRMALFAAASGIGPFLLVRRRWGASELLMVPLATSALLWAVLGTTLGRPPLRAFAPWVPALTAAGLA